MTTKKNKRVLRTPTAKKRVKKKWGTALLFWVCLLLLITPVAVMGWILFSSSVDSHAPVIGSRYDGDLDPAITKENMDAIAEKLKTIEGVDSSFVNMTTATLRAYADVKDDANKDFANQKADEIYNIIAAELDPNVYFTQVENKKMYDVEVHVYNLAENRDSDAFVYVIKEKTSSMEKPRSQLVSEPLDAELAQKLRDDVIAREQATPEPAAEDDGEVILTGEDLPEGEEGAEGEGAEQ